MLTNDFMNSTILFTVIFNSVTITYL